MAELILFVRRHLVPISALLTTGAVHVLGVMGTHGPVLYGDELGYLGIARFLAGGAAPQFDGIALYDIGYSLLIAPAYLITQRSGLIWYYAVALNVVLVTLITYVGMRIASEIFKAPRKLAWASGVAASLAPSLILQPGRVWVESLLPLLLLLSVLLLFRTHENPSPKNAALLVVVLAYLSLTHGRGIAILASFAAVAIYGFLTHRSTWIPAAATLIGLVVGIGANLLSRSWLSTALFHERQPATAENFRHVLDAFRPENLANLYARALGHLWYLLVASLVLAAIGVIAWSRTIRESNRLGENARMITSLSVVAAVPALLLLSAAFLSDGSRVDHLVYGRYVEIMLPLLLVGSICLLGRQDPHRVPWILSGTSLATVSVLLVIASGTTSLTGNVQKLTIPGLLGFQAIIDRGGEVFIPKIDVGAIAVLTMLIVAVLASLSYYSARLSAWTAIILIVVLSFGAKVTSWEPFVDFWYKEYASIPSAFAWLDDDAQVWYDATQVNPGARNLYEFRYAPRVMRFTHDPCEVPPGDYVITRNSGASQWIIASDNVPDQELVRVPALGLPNCPGS